MKGWQRICLVVFLLWAVGISIFLWSAINEDARNSAKYAEETCRKENSVKQMQVNCSDIYNNKFEERRQSEIKKDWEIMLAFIFAPPLIIFVVWIFSYIAIRIFYWVKAGFSENKSQINFAKKAVILAIFIIGLFLAYRAMLAIQELNKQSRFNVSAAQCELEAIKSRLEGDNSDEYVKLCMKMKGYNFKYLDSSCRNYLLTYYGCYD